MPLWTARCLDCGYTLIAEGSARCPECGRPYDSGDAATYDCPTHIWHYPRWASAPPSWRISVLGGTTPCVVWLASELRFSALLELVTPGVMVLVFILSAEYVIRLACAVRQVRCAPRGMPSAFRRRPAAWGIAALLIAVAWSSMTTMWPVRARFLMSQRALQRSADDALRSATLPPAPRWIGLYIRAV